MKITRTVLWGGSTYPNLIGIGFRVTKQLRAEGPPGHGTLEILNFKIGYNHDTIFKLPHIKANSTFKYETYSSSLDWRSLIKSDTLGHPISGELSSHGCAASSKLHPFIGGCPTGSPVRSFCLKPTLICLYGIEKNKVTQMAAKIRQISPPSTYTRKGLFIVKSP